MEAEGENSEFLSETEVGPQSTNEESSDDDEVVFSSQNSSRQSNNNASLDLGELEERECTQEDSHKGVRVEEPSTSAQGSSINLDAEKLIESKINESLGKVQNYFEQKFADMTKVLELQNQ